MEALQDDNAGAIHEQRPTQVHAERIATVAKEHGNSKQLTAQNINKASSQLGQALSTFMGDKRKTEM